MLKYDYLLDWNEVLTPCGDDRQNGKPDESLSKDCRDPQKHLKPQFQVPDVDE